MDEYNPRKDRKKHVWFRMENTIPFSRNLNGLNPGQKWFWACLIAFASAEQRDWTEYDLGYFMKHVEIGEADVHAAIKHFKDKRMIEIIPADQFFGSGNQSTPEVSDPETTSEPSGNQVVTTGEPDGNQAGSSGVPTDGQTDETDGTYGQTDRSPVLNLKWEKFKTLLAEPNNIGILNVLSHVSDDVQQNWLIEFHDPEWLLKTLRKAIAKRKARNLAQEPEEWGIILTSWLYNEDNPPAKPKVIKYFTGNDSSPSAPVDPEKVSNLTSKLLEELNQKSAGGTYAN